MGRQQRGSFQLMTRVSSQQLNCHQQQQQQQQVVKVISHKAASPQ